ncbi:PASTA domain-containing protein [Meiothermus sp.]|uniref:PASTA domain-containing protein n=1 Tax=Meiothermus sp. TaxID=1955249 RepID=UPI0025D34EE4|nr:PASTA domain-containing protein [Meiothermus sp.]MCS7067015.1 PASTA domain-containing protein [Meiothermus sp.]
MSLLDDKFTILSEEPPQGFLRPYQVQTQEGLKGQLYWFEVHTPEARTAFHRYKNALRRLEAQGFLPQGVLVSANPGRYYVFWPEQPKAALKARRLKPLLEILEPFGYQESDLEATEESGRPLVGKLRPQTTPAPGGSSRPDLNPTLPAPPSELPPTTSVQARPAMPPQPSKASPTPKATKPRPPQRAYRWNWPGWLPGVLMLALGGVALWLATNRYLNPPEYVLPDLVGKTPRQALEAVRTYGLKVEFAEGSDVSLPKDQILEQTPDPGTRVKPGRQLELVINKPRFGSVPTVSGRSLEDARQALEASGYRVAGITRIASGDTADTVLSSIPREGQPLRPGEGVRLLVSTGTRPPLRETLLPDLTGLTDEEARYILTVAELQAQVVRVASGAPEGLVIGQEPGPGVVLPRETVVRVLVAAQPVATLPKATPFEPPRLAAPPPPPVEPEPTPSPEPAPATTPAPAPSPSPTTPEPPNPNANQPTPPAGPQERRVNVSYTLPENIPNAVVVITVQDEVLVNTVFEGPVQQPWSFSQEIVVRGTAVLRVLVNGEQVLESPL